jgi:hypothetical protein
MAQHTLYNAFVKQLSSFGLGCFTKPSTLFQLVGENCFTSVRVREFYETFHHSSVGGYQLK